jgi:mannose-1-phosphate guanylyltransferase
MQIVIVAGGGGARLWPYSTDNKPKQFVPLIGDKPSFLKVYEYLTEAFALENIWVNINQRHIQFLQELIPDYPLDRILIEPEKRDTYAAYTALAAKLSHTVGEEEPIIFVTSDEFFQTQATVDQFISSLQSISAALKQKEFDMVTLGIRPSYANVNYGYIEIDEADKARAYFEVVKVKRYREKPNLETAQEFVAQGNFVWHKCTPSLTYKSLKKNLQSLDPVTLSILEQIRETGEIRRDLFQQIPKTSIEYAVMEKIDSIGVKCFEAEDWVEAGNWGTAKNFLPALNQNPHQIEIEGQNNKVKLTDPSRKVAFVGVSNLVLVESEEGILVVNPDHAAKVKDVANYFANLNENT